MIAKTKGAFTVAALVKEGEIDKALDALVTETERVKRYGFTASEYDRARINVLKQYESLSTTATNKRTALIRTNMSATLQTVVTFRA